MPKYNHYEQGLIQEGMYDACDELGMGDRMGTLADVCLDEFTWEELDQIEDKLEDRGYTMALGWLREQRSNA